MHQNVEPAKPAGNPLTHRARARFGVQILGKIVHPVDGIGGCGAGSGQDPRARIPE